MGISLFDIQLAFVERRCRSVTDENLENVFSFSLPVLVNSVYKCEQTCRRNEKEFACVCFTNSYPGHNTSLTSENINEIFGKSSITEFIVQQWFAWFSQNESLRNSDTNSFTNMKPMINKLILWGNLNSVRVQSICKTFTSYHLCCKDFLKRIIYDVR